MRILMISDVYFPRINGVSTSIQTFRRGLHAAGHETVLIAPGVSGALPPTDETRILRVPSRGVPRDPEDRAMKLGALRALRAQARSDSTPTWCTSRRLSSRTTRVQPRARAARAGRRDLSHVFRGVPASLRAVHAARGDAVRCAPLHRLPVQCARCAGRAVPRDGASAARLRRATVRCTSFRPAWRWSASPAATASAFASSSASRRTSPSLVHVGRIAHEKNIEFLFRMFARVVRSKPGRDVHRCRRRPGAGALQGVRALARDRRSTCVSSAICRATRSCSIATGRRSVRVLLADRDAGPGAARSDGARRPGRVDGAHGHGGHHQPGARRARGARR